MSGPAASRLVEVEPERLPGWARRFGAAHGGVTAAGGPDAVLLAAADGARASLEVPWPPLASPPSASPPSPSSPPPEEAVRALADHAAAPRLALLVLVRRGGWAVGTARAGELLDAATGTRYVQARTAAGGWSQQRYARRRSGQAAGLVAAAAEGLAAVVLRAPEPPEVLVPGGDRLLVAEVLAAAGATSSPRAVAAAAALPAGALLDVPDPRRAVLAAAARRARCVRVRVTDPPA